MMIGHRSTKTVKMESKRWMITWPWKDKNPILLTNEALALNEYLYRGDVMHPDSIGITRRFPPKNIGITADIEKAFLMDTLNFLCLKDHRILRSNGFSPGLQSQGRSQQQSLHVVCFRKKIRLKFHITEIRRDQARLKVVKLHIPEMIQGRMSGQQELPQSEPNDGWIEEHFARGSVAECEDT